MRYQLLTAIAGSIAWAQQLAAPKAVLVVYEFQTSQTITCDLQRNAQDLKASVRRLTAGTSPDVEVGILVGPVRVPGEPLFDKPADLYLGKIARCTSPPAP